VFLGTYSPRLDDKGRLTLPAKFRDDLAGGLVITKAQERCLAIYPADEFAQISAGLRTGAVATPALRAFSRVFFASASDEIPDRQGRVLIPPILRDYAGLDRDVLVTGANNRVEVWNPESWDAYLTESESAFGELTDKDLPAAPEPAAH
jgi:MraZ protein